MSEASLEGVGQDVRNNKKPALSGPSIILCLFLNDIKMLQITEVLRDHHHSH